MLIRFFIFSLLAFSSSLHAATQHFNLNIAYKSVNLTGKKSQAITINGTVPGPTLHFKEGDRVVINVRNCLDKETAVHWHGILLPWQMDGVLAITQKGIQPGKTFRYEFTAYQSGTYWYHAHAGLQEQQGLYGAMIIDPLIPSAYKYNKDLVMVLSDWSDTRPEQIFANLKKDGEYYAPRFPLQPSLAKFLSDYLKAKCDKREKLVNAYLSMQYSRMGIYDFSDVGYDTFLLNGHSAKKPWRALVHQGDTVRLRFIGAAGSTIFNVKIPGKKMQMIHVQGNDVRPYAIDHFSIASGETYDVLVKVTDSKPLVVYAESLDTLGYAVGVLETQPQQPVQLNHIKPFPEPKPIPFEMMSNMKKAGHMHKEMRTEPSMHGDHIISGNKSDAKTIPGTKYEKDMAVSPTNDPNKAIAGTLKLELFGYMDRFIWFINGLPEYLAKPIVLDPGKRYRFVFTNSSMMHHPMHIHGHWFILRKGLGRFDPLLHTIDVPPGATIVADVDTDASGQWFFHCHFLYHMVAGMARVVQYSSLIELTQGLKKPENMIRGTAYHNREIVRVDQVRPIPTSLVNHPTAHPMQFFVANYLDAGFDPFHNVQEITFKGLYGGDYNKLQLLTKDAEISKGVVEYADLDIFYWRLLSQYWSLKGGVNYFYRPALKPYWQVGMGLEGVTPFFIETDIRGYLYAGSIKLDMEFARSTQLIGNFFLRLAVRSILASETKPRPQLGKGLNQMRYNIAPFYRLVPGFSVFAEYEYQRNYGDFKKFQLENGGSAVEVSYYLGFSYIF